MKWWAKRKYKILGILMDTDHFECVEEWTWKLISFNYAFRFLEYISRTPEIRLLWLLHSLFTSFTLVWWCHQLLSGFLLNGHLPQVSCQSCLLASDKPDNEMKLGIMHRSPDICFTAEENPGKLLLGDCQMKAAWPVIASNGVLYLQMTSIDLSGRENEVMNNCWLIVMYTLHDRSQ